MSENSFMNVQVPSRKVAGARLLLPFFLGRAASIATHLLPSAPRHFWRQSATRMNSPARITSAVTPFLHEVGETAIADAYD